MGAYRNPPAPLRQAASFDAGTVARALVLAAVLTDELSVLIKQDEAALAGKVQLRARWLAFAALLGAGETRPLAVGYALGCGREPLALLERQRQRIGWNEAQVTSLTLSLITDSPLEGAAAAGVERAVAPALASRHAR